MAALTNCGSKSARAASVPGIDEGGTRQPVDCSDGTQDAARRRAAHSRFHFAWKPRHAPARLWRPRRRTPGSLAWLVALAVLPASPALGQSLEYAIKATYLHKFAPFVAWPSPAAEFPNGGFVLCAVGDDSLGGMLDRAAAGQQVDSHPIVIRRFASVSGNPGCSVMYVTGPRAQVVSDLAAVRGQPVLTVTDGASDPAATGMINFVIEDGRVRFDINNTAAAADGLTISSKLLSLAVHVTGGNR